MVRLCLQLEEEQAARYREALRRIRDVEVTDSLAESHAVITDELAVAQSAARALWLPSGSAMPDEDHIMPAAEWRFRPSLQVIADRLAQGKLGEPGLLRIHRWIAPTNLVADLDIACWLFSGEPDSVYVLDRQGYLQVHLGFEEGGMAIVDHVSDSKSRESYESLTIIGGDGAAYADDHHNTNLLYDSSGCQGRAVSEIDSGLVDMLNAFVAAVRDERDYPVTLADLKLAESVNQRVLESAETKKVLST